jgi:hypothetical protein
MKKTEIKMLALKSNRVHLFGEELDGAAILTSFLKTVYKLDDKAIESVLKHGKIVKDGETSTDVATPDSILATLTSLDKSRIGTLKESIEKESYQKGYTKAKAEALTAAETEFKEKYGVESDLKGAELVEFIVTEQMKKSGKIDTANEAEVKKSTAYQAMEKKLLKELKDAKEAGETKVKELEASYKREGTFTKVGQSALDLLNGLNPILPKNATVAETYKKDFLNELKGYEYEEKDGKVLVSKDGKLLEDGHGNTLSWEDHVKTIAGNRFEFAVNNGGDNGGDKNDPAKKGGPVGYPAGINKPKNDDELSAVMNSDKLKPAEKRVVLTEYESRTAAK